MKSYSSEYSSKNVKIEKKDSEINSLNVNYLNNSANNFYIIGPGDTLSINVGSAYPELISTSIVDGEGTIVLPLINKVYVAGLTLDELNVLLDESYLEFTKYPSVQSEIITYRPVKILVDGEVNSPGYHILPGSSISDLNVPSSPLEILNDNFNTRNFGTNSKNLFKSNNSIIQNNKISYAFPTIFDAIRRSDGITQYSDLSDIQVIRKSTITSGIDKITTNLNFEAFIVNGDTSQNIRIYDGDIIKIKKLPYESKKIISNAIKSNLNPKFINVFVGGRVRNPGPVTLRKLSTLNDAIEIAGGTKFLKGSLKYLSYNTDGTLEKRKISYKKNRKAGSYNNPNLKEGDFIIVGQSIFSNASEAISEVTSPFQGLLSTYMLYEAFSE